MDLFNTSYLLITGVGIQKDTFRLPANHNQQSAVKQNRTAGFKSPPQGTWPLLSTDNIL